METMNKKNKIITAEEMHDVILNMSIDEYYKLFELMFFHICNFLTEAEKLVKKYNETKEAESKK